MQIKHKRQPWKLYRIFFLTFCISWLIGALIPGIDLLASSDPYALSGNLEEIYFRVGKRGNDELLLTIDGTKYELYTKDSNIQEIFESILDQCSVPYDYDPDYVGETVESLIDSDLPCEARLLSTLSHGEIILDLTFGGVNYTDFDVSYAAWKNYCMSTAISLPVMLAIMLLGNRFFQSTKQE